MSKICQMKGIYNAHRHSDCPNGKPSTAHQNDTLLLATALAPSPRGAVALVGIDVELDAEFESELDLAFTPSTSFKSGLVPMLERLRFRR